MALAGKGVEPGVGTVAGEVREGHVSVDASRPEGVPDGVYAVLNLASNHIVSVNGAKISNNSDKCHPLRQKTAQQ